MTAVAAVLSALALLLTAFLAAAVFDRSDPAGHGLAQVWAAGEALVLWLLLAALIAICSRRGGFPGRAAWVVWIAYFAVLAAQLACFMAIDAMRDDSLLKLTLQCCLILSPLLVIVRTSWNILPSMRRLVPPPAMDMWTAALLLLLALLPWLPLWSHSRSVAAARLADQEAVRIEEEKQQRLIVSVHAANLRDVRGFPATVPLSQVITYTTTDVAELRDAARARARTLGNRQAEAEEMLAKGDERLLRELAYLDLAPTPAVCNGGRAILSKRTADWLPEPDPKRAWFDEIEWQISPHTASIEWLVTHGCDCSQELERLAEIVRRSKATAASGRFQAWLTGLKGRAAAR